MLKSAAAAFTLAVVLAVGQACPSKPAPPTNHLFSVMVQVWGEQGSSQRLTGARVTLQLPSGDLIGATDALGAVIFSDIVMPEHARLTVTEDGYLPYVDQPYDLQDGDNTTLSVQLFPAPPALPPAPTRAQALDIHGCLGNLVDSQNRIIWGSALPGAPLAARQDWYAHIVAAGCTHVVLGAFTPGVTYNGIGIEWANPDWTHDAAAIRAQILEIESVMGPQGYALVPIVFGDSGDPNPIPRLNAFFPVLAQALAGLDGRQIVVPSGWEPVPGGYQSVEVSYALEHWHDQLPGGLVGYHCGVNATTNYPRCIGSSNPVEPTDPWRLLSESDFDKTHGGQYIDVKLYEFGHGDGLYDPTCTKDQDTCFLNRFNDYVLRNGAGLAGWRQMPIAAFETCAEEFTHRQRTAADCLAVARRIKHDVCDPAGVACGFGNTSFPIQ